MFGKKKKEDQVQRIRTQDLIKDETVDMESEPTNDFDDEEELEEAEQSEDPAILEVTKKIKALEAEKKKLATKKEEIKDNSLQTWASNMELRLSMIESALFRFGVNK